MVGLNEFNRVFLTVIKIDKTGCLFKTNALGVPFNDCKILFCLLVTLLFTLRIYGQEEFIQPSSKLLTNFPFKQFSGGVVVVKAQLNNIPDSLNFILDTGSGGISIDSLTTERLKIKTLQSDKTIRGIAGMRTVRFAYNNTLHLPGLRACRS